MSQKKFIYFLVEEDGRSRQLQNGVVTSLSHPKMLQHAPHGNQDISLGWQRSDIDHGTVVSFSIPLKFYAEGARILRNDFYKFNVDRKLFLLIKKLHFECTDSTFKEYYKHFYKGELDFSNITDDLGGAGVEINVMQGGLQKLMKAAENTKFDIDLTNGSNIRMDGMFIVGQFDFFIPVYENLSDGYPSVFILPSDNSIPGLALFTVMQYASGGDPNADSFEYFAEAVQDIEGVQIEGLITNLNNLGASGPLSVRIIIFNTITNSIRQTIDLTPDDPYPEHYDLVINKTIDLLKGDRVFLKSASHFGGEGNLSIKAKSKPEQSNIKALTLYDVGRALVEKITGNADNFESALLQDIPILLTSGDGVRGIPDASLKTTWLEFKKACDVMLCTQVTIDTKVRIEERGSAYRPESELPAIELGSIKELKIRPAKEFMGTSIKVGHRDQQVDDTNGKFDFNGFQIYSTPIKRISAKEIDLQSPYKASPYEIEQTRANYEGKVTTDKETDNDVFAIACIKEEDNVTGQASFFDGNHFLVPDKPVLHFTIGTPRLQKGMKIRITGSALNSRDYYIEEVGDFFGQLIVLDSDVEGELNVNITIDVLVGKYYSLDRSINIDQLTDPDVSDDIKASVFNAPLSPKRILQKHYRWLAGAFYHYAPASLVFESANRNKDMIAGGIVESANVPVADLGSPMFLPFWMEFTLINPIDPEIFETNPNPVFAFEWNGRRYTGFIWQAGFAASTLEEQTFKLLACPDNDMESLING